MHLHSHTHFTAKIMSSDHENTVNPEKHKKSKKSKDKSTEKHKKEKKKDEKVSSLQ